MNQPRLTGVSAPVAGFSLSVAVRDELRERLILGHHQRRQVARIGHPRRYPPRSAARWFGQRRPSGARTEQRRVERDGARQMRAGAHLGRSLAGQPLQAGCDSGTVVTPIHQPALARQRRDPLRHLRRERIDLAA